MLNIILLLSSIIFGSLLLEEITIMKDSFALVYENKELGFKIEYPLLWDIFYYNKENSSAAIIKFEEVRLYPININDTSISENYPLLNYSDKKLPLIKIIVWNKTDTEDTNIKDSPIVRLTISREAGSKIIANGSSSINVLNNYFIESQKINGDKVLLYYISNDEKIANLQYEGSEKLYDIYKDETKNIIRSFRFIE